MLARVRVDHQRQRRQALQVLQRRRGIFQRDAVNAQRDDMRRVGQRADYVTQRCAVAQVFAVTQGKGEPRPGAGLPGQKGHQRLNLNKRRQRFAGQQVSARIQQRFHARAVEGRKRLSAAHVVTAIL